MLLTVIAQISDTTAIYYNVNPPKVAHQYQSTNVARERGNILVI
jgi:hypothetical protein